MRYGVLALFAMALAVMPVMVSADDVNEGDLQTFATIYLGMEDARTELAQEMAAAESPEAAEAVREGANERMIAVIEDNGWTLDRYNEVAAAINEDEELRAQVLTMLQDRS